MTLLGKLSGPVVRARARLHAHQARRPIAHGLQQLGARYLGLHHLGFASLIDTVHREDVLGEIDSNRNNGHDFPFRVS